MMALRRKQAWQKIAARGRKSPWTMLLVLLLSLAQIQYTLAAITNTVVASGSYNGATISSPPATVNVDVQNLAPALSVDKRAVTPTYVNAGDVLTFDIDVTNTGNATITAITVSDPDADALVCPAGGGNIPTLAPSQTVTCTATMIIVPGDVTAGSVTNTTDVNGIDPAGNPVGPAQDTETVFRTAADVVTVKSLGSTDPTPNEGDTVTFRIDVTNNGPEQATGVELTDVLPAGLSHLSDTGAGLYDPGTGIWNVGTVPTGVTATLEISATVDAGTSGQTITNSVSVSGLDQNDTNPAGDDLTESITVTSADLVTSKSLLTPGTPLDGETVEFQIVVTNNGPDDATNISLTDTLPAGLTPSGAVATASQGSYDQATGVWTVGTLANGASATITLEATVDVGQGGNTLTNMTTAALSADVGDPSTIGDNLDASVTIGAPTIDAVDDTVTAAGMVAGLTGATNVLNIFDNDTINANPFTATEVNLTNLTTGSPLTLNPDGSVDVAPGTPSGTHVITYEICISAYPSVCDTAIVSVPVSTPAIDAVDDTAAGIDGLVGATGVLNVFANDTLNTNPVAAADVNLTNLTPGGPLTLNPDGSVDVAPGTADGVYTITYEICVAADPTVCDTAVVSVTVSAPTIDAVDDGVSDVDGLTGATGVVNVFDNDTLNSNPIVAGDVNLTNLTTGGPLTLNPDGSVDVAAGTPAGAYTITYEICAAASPSVCDTAVVTVTVALPVIDAVDDSTTLVANGATGTDDYLNVFDNDTLNNGPFPPAAVTVTIVSQSPGSFLILQPDGTIDVPAGTPQGTYTLVYEICDVVNPTVCDTATATVVVEVPASIAGVVYEDSNGNGAYDPGSDAPQGGYTVELITGGIVIATAVTAPDGTYNISPIPAGPGYRLVFRDPSGNIIGGISNITLSPGENLIDQDMPIDPSGVVYDALTRLPVAGAVVTLADTAGNPLPAVCLVDPASQGQTTGADGGYRFDIIPGADPACPVGETRYQILVAPPAGYVPAVSTILPPMPGDAEITACTFDAVPGGACQTAASNTPPPPGTPALYAISILLEAGDPHFIHNHIPVDPVPNTANITVTKVADRRVVRRGERIGYTIEITNQDTNVHPNLTLIDVIPAGFRYVEGSATIDGTPATPAVAGARLEFVNINLGPDQTITIRISLDALSTAGPGKYSNRARLFDPGGNLLAPEAVATVEIQLEAVFDCSDVIGRVFDDQNRDGYMNDGEPGLPGVRLATVNGLLITTDQHGRFHVACAEIPDKAIGSNFILKLDTRTLPTGYRLTTENPRVVRLTAGKTAKMNFGAATGRVVRLDLNGAAFEDGTAELKPKWLAGIDQLVEVLRQEHSVLRLIYRAGQGEGELARERVNAIIAIVRDRWDSFSESYPLEIESEIQK